jgi:hypothetical protein
MNDVDEDDVQEIEEDVKEEEPMNFSMEDKINTSEYEARMQHIDELLYRCRFTYTFEHTPWFLQKPQKAEVRAFDASFIHHIRLFFKRIRANPNINPNTVVAPELAGLTAGDLALLWVQTRHIRRQTTDIKLKLKQNKSARKLRTMPVSTKIRKMHSNEPFICFQR